MWKVAILAAAVFAVVACPFAAYAQGFAPVGEQLAGRSPVSAPVNLAPVRLAQQVPLGPIPTDITPVDLGRSKELLEPGWRFRLYQSLPAKMWFSSSTEVSQRLDTNVFFTYNKPRADYTFRVLPNVLLGYNVFSQTSVYCNYFVIKDLFAAHGNQLSFPTTQSLALGFRQDIPVGTRTFAQLDFQARELWQTSHLRQSDLLPAINLTRLLGANAAVFGSALLQLRGSEYFTGGTREIDPFYSLGALWRRGMWTFVATDTLVTNFRNKHAIPPNGNVSMIADFEASYPVSRRYPGLVWFIRAEPIWNWSSHKVPGLSGFDMRLFGGMRLTLSKPSYAAAVEKLKQQLKDAEPGAPKRPPAAPPASSSTGPPAGAYAAKQTMHAAL